jgi:phosphatidylglycerol:prolipoprotein diacylglycerol transferase
MHPVLFSIGPLHFYSYGALVAIGIFLAVFFLQKKAKAISVLPETMVDLAIATVVSGFIGARIFYIVQFWDYFKNAPLDMIKLWQGGLVLYGGLIGGILGFISFIKLKQLPFLKVLDLFVIATAIAQGFGRIGCFFNGCCYGSHSDLPWVVSFPFLDHAVHPTQLYESAFCFLLAFFLFSLWKRKRRVGMVSAAYFILYPLGRFVLECFRGDNANVFYNLTFPQWMSMVIVLIVLLTTFIFYGTKRIHRSS